MGTEEKRGKILFPPEAIVTENERPLRNGLEREVGEREGDEMRRGPCAGRRGIYAHVRDEQASRGCGSRRLPRER
jgi:hypothetical protein